MLNQRYAWIHAESILIQLHCVVCWKKKKTLVQVSVKTEAWRYWHKHLRLVYLILSYSRVPKVNHNLFSSSHSVSMPMFVKGLFYITCLNNRLAIFINTRATHKETVMHSWINLTLPCFLYACIPVSSSSQKKIISSLLCRCVHPGSSRLGVLLVSVIA